MAGFEKWKISTPGQFPGYSPGSYRAIKKVKNGVFRVFQKNTVFALVALKSQNSFSAKGLFRGFPGFPEKRVFSKKRHFLIKKVDFSHYLANNRLFWDFSTFS